MNNIQQDIDKLYKDHFGEMVATLLRNFRDLDLEDAEDIVQEAFSAALTKWEVQGRPQNPAGWFYTVCKNNAINKLRSDKKLKDLGKNGYVVDVSFNGSLDPSFEGRTTGDGRTVGRFPEDHQLQLLFACAHPDLSPKSQVAITLKYVLNFRVDAIARVLGLTIDGVDKLLLRARQKIREEKILLELPPPATLRSRLGIVHKIIYLLFNEGYKSSWGKEIIREELCEEALILNRLLIGAGLGNGDTAALQALMLFGCARFKARFDESGQLLDLERQDRSLWNKELILLGFEYLDRSGKTNISTYHLEAYIASLHCNAPSFGATDWETISKLYSRLLKNGNNPFVEMNYAIALYYAGNKVRTFEILHELLRNSLLNQYYLLNFTIGKFYFLEGNVINAGPYLLKAREQTTFPLEKELIQAFIDRLS